MFESVKIKILATIIHLFSADIERESYTRKPEELCENLPRLEVMAEGIEIGSRKLLCSETEEEICWKDSHEELAFYMTSMAFHETRFLERIHAGNCLSNECDPVFREWKGHKYLAYHGARTPWQLHKTLYIKDEEWKTMVGTDLESTIVAATAASRVFTFAKNRCRTVWGGYGLYATGKTCKWSGAGQRVWVAQKYMKASQDPKWIQEKLDLTDICKEKEPEEKEEEIKEEEIEERMCKAF